MSTEQEEGEQEAGKRGYELWSHRNLEGVCHDLMGWGGADTWQKGCEHAESEVVILELPGDKYRALWNGALWRKFMKKNPPPEGLTWTVIPAYGRALDLALAIEHGTFSVQLRDMDPWGQFVTGKEAEKITSPLREYLAETRDGRTCECVRLPRDGGGAALVYVRYFYVEDNPERLHDFLAARDLWSFAWGLSKALLDPEFKSLLEECDGMGDLELEAATHRLSKRLNWLLGCEWDDRCPQQVCHNRVKDWEET